MEAKPFLKEILLNTETIPDKSLYPYSIPALKNFESIRFHPDVTFIVGENGSGKSTLIEAIALHLGFGFDGGSKGVQYDPRERASDLHMHLKSVKSFSKPNSYYFLRAETFYKVASYLAEIDPDKEYGDHLHEFSHGEAFMTTLDKLGNKGLYIFDEPEAALSPSRQLAALAKIHELSESRNSQFIIATHSPILLSYPNATIYKLDEGGITQVQYEETEHYLVTREFLNNYKRVLGELLR